MRCHASIVSVEAGRGAVCVNDGLQPPCRDVCTGYHGVASELGSADACDGFHGSHWAQQACPGRARAWTPPGGPDRPSS